MRSVLAMADAAKRDRWTGKLTIERENDTIRIYVEKSYTKTLVWEGSIAEWSHAIVKASIRTVITTAPAEPQPA